MLPCQCQSCFWSRKYSTDHTCISTEKKILCFAGQTHTSNNTCKDEYSLGSFLDNIFYPICKLKSYSLFLWVRKQTLLHWFSCARETEIIHWLASQTNNEPHCCKETDKWLVCHGPLASDTCRELPILWLQQCPVAEALCTVPHFLSELLLEQLGNEAFEAVLRGGDDLRWGRGQV